MRKFSIPEMSCGHCVAAIEKSVKALDPKAAVKCDLDSRTAEIESAFGEDALALAIKDAGYESRPTT